MRLPPQTAPRARSLLYNLHRDFAIMFNMCLGLHQAIARKRVRTS